MRSTRYILRLERLEFRELLTSVVHIDALDVARSNGRPMLLNRPGTTYVLDTDVSVSGTAFIAAAPDVTFDLNGHTIRYGDTEPIEVQNGGFEFGSGDQIPGWNLNAAPAAEKVPAMTGMYGRAMLEFANITSKQTIVSEPIAIPTANHEYAAAITPKGPYGSKVTVKVIDAITGSVLGTASSPSTERGFGAVVTFTPTKANAVRLQIDVEPPNQQSGTIALDYAAVVPSRDYGVMATQLWSGQFPKHLQLDYIIEDYRDAANFTIRNGSIIQGDSRGRSSSPLFFQELPGFCVTDVTTFVTGMDTHNLDANFGHDGRITASTFDGSVDRVSNRMDIVAAICLNNFYGTASVVGNHIGGVPHVGILVSGMPEFAGISILNNDIRQNTVVTDGYGILFAGVRNFDVGGNTIVPKNGRGILIDGWGRIATENGIIHDNYVEIVERPNLEYGDELEATALRMRNEESTFRNLLITQNTFIARTGPGGVYAAQGMRLSAFNDQGQMNNSNVQITRNHFKAIVTTANPAFIARAISISQVDDGTGLVIAENLFESNDTSLALGDSDSWQGSTEDLWMGFNTLRRTHEGAERPFVSVIAGEYQTAVSDIYMPSTFLQNGATAKVVYGDGPVTNLQIEWKRI